MLFSFKKVPRIALRKKIIFLFLILTHSDYQKILIYVFSNKTHLNIISNAKTNHAFKVTINLGRAWLLYRNRKD